MFGLGINFAHAFGQRYELPIPLYMFIIGGAGIVLISFLFIVRQGVSELDKVTQEDSVHLRGFNWIWAILSFVFLGLIITAGIFGSQEIPENILPTLFWLYIWIAVPLSCGVIGDWTQAINPFANISKLTDSKKLRKLLTNRTEPINWPKWLGWWPAVTLFFFIACGELVFNETAVRPVVTGAALLIYFIISALFGVVFGQSWLKKGEVFSVLFSTWGRLGFFRFGSAGKKGFAGGLVIPFEASVSRITFVLLLLVSVSFDGLLSTPTWSRFLQHLPSSFDLGTLAYGILATSVFVLLVLVTWFVFSLFANAVTRAGGYKMKSTVALAGLLPSLLPISFGYLLAHNIEYLLVNGQLMAPLIGNPIGKESWPIHLPYPFNDNYEPHLHLLPSSFYWYFSILIIILVHIIAVYLAHQHLGSLTKDELRARRSEYPWVTAMILYTMLSLWLLAQPLVKEKPYTKESMAPATIHIQSKT